MNFTGLRFKLITVAAASLLLLLLVHFFANQALLLKGYTKLESDKTYMQVNNANRMIALQQRQLQGLTQDWGHWDDTYNYITKQNPSYIKANVNNEVFTNLKINTIALVNNKGEIIFEKSRNFINNQDWKIPLQLKLAISKNGVFSKPSNTGYVTGLLWTTDGLMMVSAMDILPSSLTGKRNGVLIMARRIDALAMQDLAEIVGAKVNISYIADYNKASDPLRKISQLITAKNNWAMQVLSNTQVAGYMQLKEIGTGNDLILSTVSDRTIFALGKNSSSFIIYSSSAILLLLMALSLLFDKLVMARLSKLNNSVDTIIDSADMTKRVPTFSGNDEIANLGQRINGMLSNLDERQKALEGAGDGSWDWNFETGVVQYSARWKSILGYSEQDILPQHHAWKSHLHPDDLVHARTAMQDYLAGLKDIYISEYRLRCKDNSYKWTLGRGMIVSRTTDGQPLRMIGTHIDIDERKKIEKSLHDNEQRYRLLIEAANMSIVVAQGNTLKFANSKAIAMSGYSEAELMLLPFTELIYGDDRPLMIENFQKRLKGDMVEQRYQVRILRKDKSIRWAEMSGALIEWEGQSATLNYVLDITERKQTERELTIAATAFESQEGMMVTDAQSIILRVNHAFTRITGYTADDTIGKTPRMLNAGLHDANYFNAMWERINDNGYWEGEIYNRRKNGEVYPQQLTITAVKDVNGAVCNYVATLTDITSSKEAAEKIHQMAFYDTLTKLPNRRLLLDRLNHALSIAVRFEREGALLFLDLDHFKLLNDTLGHDVGDLLLQQVALRLSTCVREGDTVSRIGGDEFVILIENLSNQLLDAATQVEVIGNKILSALAEPYLLGSHAHHSGVSIGVVLFGGHASSQEELLKQADIAMYNAKKAGRNNMRFFDPLMQDAINSRAEMERDLRLAIEHNEFSLYYQIQVDSANHPLGAEALIRWLHPKQGLIAPFNFIPIAEETGYILKIGQWVLDTACKQLKLWQQTEATRKLTLSINVSAKEFSQVDFAEQVQAAVQFHAINPALLKLEMTESMLIDHMENVVTTMTALQNIGVGFELDDFGTGYSSLQYLKQLPLSQLKIDRSFIQDIVNDSSDQAIVRTIIAMAHSLNLAVIAEGVETVAQQQFLLKKGCDNFQGYLFGKPVPIDEFEHALKQTIH